MTGTQLTSDETSGDSKALQEELADRFEEVAKLTGFYLAERDRADRLQRLLDAALKERSKAVKELADQRGVATIRVNAIRNSCSRTIGIIVARQLGYAEDQRPSRADLPRLAEQLMLMGFFDRDWYLKRHPDVSNARMDAAIHYVGWGMFEGREPCALD
ncbi:MAG: hypothetical protein KDK75_02615 [Alphaproteobacteria bacterium]|nr:hypothetical protein [Alphaproteobacteria bacterium]